MREKSKEEMQVDEKNIDMLPGSHSGAGGLYFIGIGGIGMSAIARYFLSKGVKVSGYDKTETALTKVLTSEGAVISYTDSVDEVPKDVDMVVYTPAIPSTHAGLKYYRENGYNVVKRSDVLKIITESSFNICVAGTHGKTTISTMIAHLLKHTGYGCNAFLGGISSNYGTNFWSSEKNVCVIEADEYDRSFLKLSPDVAVVTAIDADHLDIYGTAEELENAFIQFSQRLKPGGFLLTKHGLSRSKDFSAAKHLTYHLNDNNADVYATNIKVQNGSYHFDVVAKDWKVENILINMGGLHNLENAVAAISIAKHLDIDDEKIKSAVSDFKGIKRRFEYILKDELFFILLCYLSCITYKNIITILLSKYCCTYSTFGCAEYYKPPRPYRGVFVLFNIYTILHLINL